MSSMDADSKMKVLRQLARTAGDAATSALEREAGKILAYLDTGVRYDVLHSQIELLDVFAFRVSKLAVEGVARFLSRLETIEITHDSEWAVEYETPAQLAVASLELLSRLRYFRTREILSIAMTAALSDFDNVQKSAADVLRRIAEFDIDAFYSGENRAGLGPAPQMVVIDFLETETDLSHHFATAVQLCSYLLSPNMSGTSWDYNSVTLKSSAIPAIPAVKEIRHRALTLLKRMYDLKADVAAKRQVINAMLESARLPNQGGYDDAVRDMISENTTDALCFLDERLLGEPFPIVQKIEHDAYWRYHHAPTDAVRLAALKIQDRVDTLEEYKIYRDLVGFEGIFQKWEERAQSRTDFRSIEDYRSKKASEYAASINGENWPQWRERILAFCETESNDLATFPKFYEFLEKLAILHPDLALDLLKDDPAQIARFTIPLLRGLWAGPLQPETRDLLWGWIARGEHLVGVTKLFWSNEQLDDDVLRFLFDRLAELGDYPGLSLLIGVAASNYAKFPHLLTSVVLPCIQILSQVGDGHWINEIWYNDDARRMLSKLDEGSRQVVLDGLVHVEEIDFHAEEVLIPLAEQDTAQMVMFFRKRIAIEDAKPEGSSYEAIPFSFHQLQNTMEKSPALVVDMVLSWFREPIDLFQQRGGHFLKSIFPTFPKPFSDELSRIVREGDKAQIEFVLDILRNYEGEQFVYDICKEILVRLSPDDEELLAELSIVLRNTGVVHGEFGFAKAYEEKATALSSWLSDPSAEVRNFAGRFVKDLRNSAEAERRRAKEDITLRKHKYGVRNDGDPDADGEKTK
ncbi:hypothetical protein ELI24_22445 [Rhizobium ruizarguesonis]|uniref:hypothetical protein n=1 Tax=Rhizobium ruizarguesonis TaxID=2081791 RepID=UPI001032332E|nr:hypothetical protein [Rhizobium ruizarguesonis]TAW00955.1 hypothetical protein ELI24_22445 [Rhizobium ruizarguesonis]